MLQRVPQFIRRQTRTVKYTSEQRQARRTVIGALLLSALLCTQWALPLTGMAVSFNPDNAPVWSRPSYERKMNEIGNKILAANNITTPILFRMSENAMDLDAQAESKHHLVLVGSALFPMVSTDDELAAILSHEIAHIITGKSGHLAGGQISLLDILGTVIFVPDAIITTVSMGQSIKQRLGRATLQNRETAMDLIGVDLMVKAGYNPTAMESILREIATDSGNKHWRNRTTITDRLKRIHGAIATKYPDFLPPEERTPTTPEQPAKEAPLNTVSAPVDQGNSQYQLNAFGETEAGKPKKAHKAKHGKVNEDQAEINPFPSALPEASMKVEPAQTTTPAAASELKNALPKTQPSEAIKTPPTQQLLDQNGQPLPATPPGLPAALQPGN